MVSFETQDLSQKNSGRPRSFYDFDVTAALERPQLVSTGDTSIVFAHSKISKFVAGVVLFFLLAGAYSGYWQWDDWTARYHESPVLYLFIGVLSIPFYLLLFFASLAILLNRNKFVFDKKRKEVRIYRGFSFGPSYQFQLMDIQVFGLEQIVREYEDGGFDMYDVLFVELQDATFVSLLVFSDGEGAEVFNILCQELEALTPQKVTADCISLEDDTTEPS